MERKEIIKAQRRYADRVSVWTQELASDIEVLQSVTGGGDIFYAEVDGTMYRIAPVDDSL